MRERNDFFILSLYYQLINLATWDAYGDAED